MPGIYLVEQAGQELSGIVLTFLIYTATQDIGGIVARREVCPPHDTSALFGIVSSARVGYQTHLFLPFQDSQRVRFLILIGVGIRFKFIPIFTLNYL